MEKIQKFKPKYLFELRLVAMGLLIGLTVGLFITFFNVAAEIVTEFSERIYEGVQQHPAFVPLLFFVLVVGAFAIATLVRLVPMIGANGVPQLEGASKGLIKLKWYTALPAMAAASIYCMLMGVEAGQECTSMFLGGAIGDGLGHAFKGSDMERRYHLMGGACAGLAVASNAPLTGMLFALEEAHRRFTPGILLCGLSSVFTATITRTLLFKALNMEVTSIFTSFSLPNMPLIGYLFAAFAAIICALIAVLFYKFALFLKKRLNRVTVLGGTVKYLIPLLFAGVAGLVTVYAVGGGHSLIENLATQGAAPRLHSLLGSPLAVTLLIILILRLVGTALNIGSGMPCGVFVPMIAIGAVIGALMSRLCLIMGMDAAYCDCIVMICMATFFATTVKAPLTAIVMTVEFTWQFSALGPVILGVAIGYILGYVFRTQPIYDALLEDMIETQDRKKLFFTYKTKVCGGAYAEGHTIRNILWADNVQVASISRGGQIVLPVSDAKLMDGDELVIEVETDDENNSVRCIEEIVKPYSHFKKREHTEAPGSETFSEPILEAAADVTREFSKDKSIADENQDDATDV